MEIKDLLNSVTKKKDDQGPRAEMSEDILCIDCRGCDKAPSVRSQSCIRCMINNLSVSGSAGRIKLRTSRDLELSGPATELLSDLASIKRTADNLQMYRSSRSCAGCDRSCERVMSSAWEGFPEPYFDVARKRLMISGPSNPSCNTCIQKTYRVLDQTELGIENIRKKISTEITKAGGI